MSRAGLAQRILAGDVPASLKEFVVYLFTPYDIRRDFLGPYVRAFV